ncbi:MAG TPA: ATP-dependent 6-phosphofructokinase [bacterium]|nr:ATP-dependent 6-phosphofructokinase [bacterium]HPQ66208.1 ATP-dependent 6-phosphofructokinase [bacterium]
MEDMLLIDSLGPCRFPSPLGLSSTRGDKIVNYVGDEERIILDVDLETCRRNCGNPPSLEKAGPRAELFFDPSATTAAIVTCGGVSPGLNNVIRGVCREARLRYGVRSILGIKYGYEGLVPEYGHQPVELTPETVEDIGHLGGTVLGTSRGRQDPATMVDFLVSRGIDILFAVGGDGTLKGALQIYREIARRGLPIAVAGIPKTIDNDIGYMDRSFGFETAFSISSMILETAHSEAVSHYNGIAVVKLMGRDSGFIAANAALANPVVNFVLIPEMDFDLTGPRGFLEALARRIEEKHHALVVIGEGAGQNFFPEGDRETDASGNVRYHDIGVRLKNEIAKFMEARGTDFTIKYIDPSYIIRSTPAIPDDRKFSTLLAQYAVHGAMAGKTGFVVGRLHQEFVHIPIPAAVREKKRIDLESQLWLDVLQATGQPVNMKN